MTATHDRTDDIVAAVTRAFENSTALGIEGGGSKAFLGRRTQLESLSTAAHRGIVNYDPTELVVTARAGTPLAELEAALDDAGQTLPFEPPSFGAAATIGGTIAAGLSGPRRPYAGAARDFVLGTRIVNGKGESLRFGGEVMKNVAGYDVSRLMVGALGTLGVLLDVSMKVLPKPEMNLTVSFECDAADAVARMNAWAGRPVPLSGAAHDGERLFVRLSGTSGGVAAGHEAIGGEAVETDTPWMSIREHTHAFFAGDTPLWRVSVPPATPALDLGPTLIDWGGALRWVRSEAPDETIRASASAVGGHAGRFRGGDRDAEVFQPPATGLFRLHRRLKDAFDPGRVLNPGRLYAEL